MVQVLLAEQRAKEAEMEAQGRSRAALVEAQNEAEARRVTIAQQAEGVKSIGEAEAFAIRQKGEAEAAAVAATLNVSQSKPPMGHSTGAKECMNECMDEFVGMIVCCRANTHHSPFFVWDIHRRKRRR